MVPPLIKYTAGPLLGPALLTSHANQRGHQSSVLDLNALYLQSNLPPRGQRMRQRRHGTFVGDHNRPFTLSGESLLTRVEDEFFKQYLLPSLAVGLSSPDNDEARAKRRIKFGFLSHNEVQAAGAALSRSSLFSTWASHHLEQSCFGGGAATFGSAPQVVGVSLFHG